MTIKNLIVVLGDQLSFSLPSLQDAGKDDVVLMMEVRDEATYVKHHPKKIILILSAMRHFAKALQEKNYRVIYIKLDSKESKGSFTETLKAKVSELKPEKIICTEPGEYRVLEMMQSWQKTCKVPVEIQKDSRFFVSTEYFKNWAKGRKELRMEFFYRELRKLTGFLMQNQKPIGGKWNFDAENRQAISTKAHLPKPFKVQPDSLTQEVIQLVKTKFPTHFGTAEPFWFAVTREQALKALKHFIDYCLPDFGDYQDAMLCDENALYHSQLSHYLNLGLLLPYEVCKAAEDAYFAKKAPLNSVEGFIRQILGWREFIRGIYWLKMPEYTKLNYFKAEQNLPEFYWSGNTDMNCLHQVISMTKRDALSHHIQRLMITGNFALLLGVEPAQVCEWYLAVYADAYEWVELPNTLGMALFGDGGYLASKPYAASGAYINKMSNFCQSCKYNVKEKLGATACPFNSLYWDFLMRNERKLRHNLRLKFAYSNLDKMTDALKSSIKNQANTFKDSLT